MSNSRYMSTKNSGIKKVIRCNKITACSLNGTIFFIIMGALIGVFDAIYLIILLSENPNAKASFQLSVIQNGIITILAMTYCSIGLDHIKLNKLTQQLEFNLRGWINSLLPRGGLFSASVKRLIGIKKQPLEHKFNAGPLVICKDHYPVEFNKSLLRAGIAAKTSGLFYLNNSNTNFATEQYPVIKDIHEVIDFIVSRNVQDIVFIENIHTDEVSKNIREALLPELLALPIRIWLAVNLEREFSVIIKRRQESYKLLPIVDDALVHSKNKGKRAFDLIIGSGLLIIFLPLLTCIAFFVRVSGPGPIIFRQTRTGAQGKKFEVLKFRTMTVHNDNDLIQAAFNDPRVTKIGQFLRRTSLDELLQLINVIKGDMSLVGPRPHALETKVQGLKFQNAIAFYRGRYRVKPGITGLAQIRGLRGETKFIEKLEQRVLSDLEYIERWSIWLDVLILLRTLPVFFTQKNAY